MKHKQKHAVAMFHLVTRHDCLAAHLYKLSIYASPKCVICNIEDSIMNRDHLQKCPVLNIENHSESSLYWEARHPSAWALDDTTTITINFLHQFSLFIIS